MDATTVTAAVSTGFNIWSFLGGLLAGGIGVQIFSFISGWVNGKGVALVTEKLEQWRASINQNPVMAQIQIDDSLFKIVEAAIPEALNTATTEVQDAIKAGNLSAIPWKTIANDVWTKVQAQVKGGANDYLQHSSFQDGAALAEVVLKKFLNTSVAQSNGLPVPASTVPAAAVPATTATVTVTPAVPATGK